MEKLSILPQRVRAAPPGDTQRTSLARLSIILCPLTVKILPLASAAATPLPDPPTIDPMAADMQQVDRVIRQRLSSQVALINQISSYIVGAGGKRIRPRLVLLFAQALGFDGPEAHELAATVEFIHTATLLHDDVVDESSLRRGQP